MFCQDLASRRLPGSSSRVNGFLWQGPWGMSREAAVGEGGVSGDSCCPSVVGLVVKSRRADVG